MSLACGDVMDGMFALTPYTIQSGLEYIVEVGCRGSLLQFLAIKWD